MQKIDGEWMYPTLSLSEQVCDAEKTVNYLQDLVERLLLETSLSWDDSLRREAEKVIQGKCNVTHHVS